VEDSRQFSNVLPSLNATFLDLIPKEDKVEDLNKFLPIDLHNIMYKIITKVIVNPINDFLPFLIYQEKTGYVEG